MKKFSWRYTNRTILLFIFISCIFTGRAENMPVWTQDPLARAMQATGAEVSLWELDGWVKINQPYGDANEVVNRMVSAAGLQGTMESKMIESGRRGASVRVACRKGNAVYHFFVKDISTQECGAAMYVSVKRTEAFPDLQGLEEKKQHFITLLQVFGVKPHINTCLKGYLDGRLMKGMDDWYIQDGMDAAGARVGTVLRDARYVSATGYTPLLAETLKAGGEPVNIHMAVRYHSFDQRTYVTIGSPVILTEY